MTILGKHTLDETRDLLAVADYRFKETGKAYDELANKPADLVSDWTALSDRWAKDRVSFRNQLLVRAAGNLLLPASAIATEDIWKAILGYVQGQELVKGSLQDVTRRIEQLSGKQIKYENQPGQNSPDVDIALFKDLDNKTKELDAAADAAKGGAKDAATSKWGLIIGGGLLAALILPSVIKRNL